jgi:hypothetical protein
MPRVAEALDALGISQTDLNGVMRPTADIIGELAAKWPELTREQQNQAAQNLVGLEQAPKLLAILNDYPGVLEATANAYASSGSASKELNVALEQSAVQADRAKVQFENLQIAVGDKFKPAVVESGAAMGNLASAIRQAVEGDTLEPFFEAVLPLFEDFGDYIDGIAEALPEAFAGVDWSDFEESIKNISESFGGIFGDLDLTNPRDLEQVIQGLIDVGALFINTTSGIIDGLEPLFTIIGSVVDAFSDLSPEVQQAAGYLLGMGTTINVLSGFVGTLSGALGGAGKVAGLVGSFAALGPVIAGASVALASFEAGKYISEVTGLDQALEEWLLGLKGIPPVIGASDDVIARSGDTYARLSEELGVVVTSQKDLQKATQDGRLVFDEATQQWVAATTAATGMGESFEAIAVDDLVGEFNALNPALAISADGTVKAADATDALSTTTRGLVSVFDAATGRWIDIADAADKGAASVSEGGEELKAVAEKAELMTRASADFILGWEKIQSAERIAIFEAKADIDIARIEADASRTIAAFDAMSSSFQNTGDVLTELFGIWAGSSGFDQDKIGEWIEREYKIREDLAKSQIALVEAEIKRMEAQTALLEKGGVEIKIGSDGLEPALEAFMFSVIDKVRVQIAGSYEDFLLGCGS